jgi:hypothetical protein
VQDVAASTREKLSEPGRRRPWVMWPLQLAVGALGLVHGSLAMAWSFATYKLNLERWYEPRPDDIFIVSYPKSGTTLLQMLLYQLTTDGEMGFSHIEDVEPWFEVQLAYSDPSAIAKLPSPRVFKSHYKQWMLPRGGKKIYIVRNLSDVALSAFHQELAMSRSTEELGEHIDRHIDGRVPYGSWYKHVKSWWPHRHDPNVLFLRYEEVTRDLAGTARRVAAFCGLPLPEDQIPRIVERCGIPFMKGYNNKFDPRFYQVSRAGEFIRTGQTGGGARALSAAQRERLEQKLAALARDIGCPSDDSLADLFRAP